jgi:cellulose synthase operon protein C
VLLQGELSRRAERLAQHDPVGSARTLVELGIFEQRVMGNEAAARKALTQARQRQPQMAGALERLRRLPSGGAVGPGAVVAAGAGGAGRVAAAAGDEALSLLDDELKAAGTDALGADLWAARGRVCVAMGRQADAREAFSQALRREPRHAAALAGLEAVLLDGSSQRAERPLLEALESHLARLTVAYGASEGEQGDDRLAAWLHVERALLLDGRLSEAAQALTSLRRAVELSPGPGAERHALLRYLVQHRDDAGLCGALVDEAEHEPEPDRAARLLYAAARIRAERLGQWQESIPLLGRALARAPATSPTARRALGELGRLHERAGDRAAAVEAWERHLALLADPATIASEHARLARTLEALGRDDEAVAHARAALADPAAAVPAAAHATAPGMGPGLAPGMGPDAQTREGLDRVLERLGKHEERVSLWLEVSSSTSASATPTATRVAALLRAARISERNLGRPDEAIEHLRAAWALAPGDTLVFDALSALVAAPPREPGEDVRGVRTRVELYADAARAAQDPERRVPLLEKLLLLWEDELSQPRRALEIGDQILALEPRHRGAILAMGRNGARAGDQAAVARSLALEAGITAAPALKRKLLLRAAELTSEALGDTEAALQLVSRAAALDTPAAPGASGASGAQGGSAINPDVLRARATLLTRVGRSDEAREALVGLVSRAGVGADEAFTLWLEIAALDEVGRRNPSDAVESYRRAAKARPGHGLPQRELSRLLGQMGDHRRLVESLRELSAGVSGVDRARLLAQAAEVLELSLGDDKAALDALGAAEAAQGGLGRDLALAEASERILLRSGDRAALAALYRRWLEAGPPGSSTQRLRIALALLLAEGGAVEASTLLDQAIADDRALWPALRLARRIHRAANDRPMLAAMLALSADVVRSSLARRGALWELSRLERDIGEGAALDALERIVKEAPQDAAALDEAVRIASRLLAADSGNPDRPAARTRLLVALRGRKELSPTVMERALFELEEASVHERDPEREMPATLAALAAYRAALALNAQSLLAARGLDRVAGELGDRESRVLGHLALAQLVERPTEQAAHLVRAADLLAPDAASGQGAQAGQAAQASQGRQLELYEQALSIDAECVAAARALTAALARDPARLAARLGDALERASDPTQVVLLGVEVGRAVLALSIAGEPGPEPSAGLRAVGRALEHTPNDPAALMLLARLQSAARLWPEARETLLRISGAATSSEARVQALFELAALYRGPLADSAQAQASLEAVLALDGRNRKALEQLHQVAVSRGDRPLITLTLRRLADAAPDAAGRVEFLLRLADAHREAGEHEARLRALAEAVLVRPDDERAMSVIARMFRPETPDGAAGFAQALTMLLALARERGVTPDPRWLSTLGMLEATLLMRPQEALEHLAQATALPKATAETRVALGRGLEVTGRNGEAVRVLRDVLAGEPEALARLDDPSAALASLEAALAKEGRPEERLAVQEVRACMGEMPAEWLSTLRNRQLGPAPFAGSLAPDELVRLLSPEARHPAVDVFVAIAPVAAKIMRFETSSLGISSRDRIGPRDGSATRALADKLARAFGVEAFELYLSPSWPGVMRAFPGDPPLLVGPDAFADLPELEQASALGQLFTRLSLGVPWLDDLAPDAIDGLFIASLRASDPSYASGQISPAREQAAQALLPAVTRAVGRKQRKMLELLLDRITPELDAPAFMAAVRRSEHRIAYLASGSLISTIDYLRRIDRELRAGEGPRVLFQHPVTGEVLRFGLTNDAYVERRRLGTVWT